MKTIHSGLFIITHTIMQLEYIIQVLVYSGFYFNIGLWWLYQPTKKPMFAESRARVLILPPITFLHILILLSYTFSYNFLTHSPITFLHILLLLSYTFTHHPYHAYLYSEKSDTDSARNFGSVKTIYSVCKLWILNVELLDRALDFYLYMCMSAHNLSMCLYVSSFMNAT